MNLDEIKPRRKRNAGASAKCNNCGGDQLHEFLCSDTIEYRGLTLTVENLKKTVCQSCKNVFETESQHSENQVAIRSAYAVERDLLREAEGLLSGAEIEHIRKYFGLNQREAAALFGGGYNAFNKYESGEVLQSIPMDRLLRLSKVIGKAALDILQNIHNPPRAYVFLAGDMCNVSSQYFLEKNTESKSGVALFMETPDELQLLNPKFTSLSSLINFEKTTTFSADLKLLK